MFGIRSKLAYSFSFVSSAIVAVACGSTDGSEFGLGKDPDNTVKGPNGEFVDTSVPKSTLDACVSSTASAALQKVNLVFMYDRSGSMGDKDSNSSFDPNLKWIPVGTGMKAFFKDPGSNTMNASLAFFPSAGDVTANCTANYAVPKVALSPADSSAFVTAIDSTKPQGGTPTVPALQGALSYAKTIAQQRPDEKTVVVLVTDGEPGFMIDGVFQGGCTNVVNDIDHVAALAADAFKGTPALPTYVIGVGPSLNNLNKIAAAGGTQAAQMVSVDDPTKTAGAFQASLDKIRGSIISCDFAMPPAPAGKTLDVDAVNVALTGASGETILSYSKDCAGGTGWRYDNLAAPSRVQLCPSTCDQARRDSQGKLTVAFGCKTKGDVR
jgi:hypothetical protein